MPTDVISVRQFKYSRLLERYKEWMGIPKINFIMWLENEPITAAGQGELVERFPRTAWWLRLVNRQPDIHRKITEHQN